MPEKIISKDKLDSFLQRLGQTYQVYAPLREGSFMIWSEPQSAQDLVWEFSNTDLSPKRFFFPQTERLLQFKNDPQDPEGMILQEPQDKAKPKALFNIRPCDAKAFNVLDLVFLQDPDKPDVYWQEKRRQTLLIGLACNHPCPTCFCSSVNCGPHHTEGLDILAQDLGDRLLLTPLSPKGEELLQEEQDAANEDKQQAAQLKDQAENMIQSQVGMENIGSRSTLEVYEQAMWNRVFESCINCGTCTYYCPTCHCFDIQDETQEDYGHRIRNWDSCMSWLFTYHTSGHNPRGRKLDRVRQRFMHKFKYMPFKLQGAVGCVGCGRCTQKCPVNIDVREVVNSMNS